MELTGKSLSFVILALKHYIHVLEAGRDHCFDDQSFFDNDIAYYRSILRGMEEADQMGVLISESDVEVS